MSISLNPLRGLKRLFRKRPIRIRVVTKDESKLRLHEWQSDPRLCSMASKMLDDANVRLMLSVLKNEHPCRTALPYGVSMDDRVVLQARSEGYEMALANLEAMARSNRLASVPEAVFEEEQELVEQE